MCVDDSWLTISPELLDELLEARFGAPDASGAASEDQLKAGLETLLTHPSDVEGVEVGSDLQEKLRKLSTMSLPRKKQSQATQRKASHAGRKVSMNAQMRKISSQSCASNSSEMSSLSSKIDFNADSFMDAVKNMLGKYYCLRVYDNNGIILIYVILIDCGIAKVPLTPSSNSLLLYGNTISEPLNVDKSEPSRSCQGDCSTSSSSTCAFSPP